MNKQIQAVRTDGIKKDSALKDNKGFELIKIIEGKCEISHARTYQKIWEDKEGFFWVSHHRDHDFDEERPKHKIQKRWF